MKIARTVGEMRGEELPWNGNEYAISIGLAFAWHGSHSSDVDNHIKPIQDAAATALLRLTGKNF